jgi:hypothetical protein
MGLRRGPRSQSGPRDCGQGVCLGHKFLLTDQSALRFCHGVHSPMPSTPRTENGRNRGNHQDREEKRRLWSTGHTLRVDPSPLAQFRQLGDVRRNPPRLVFGHEIGAVRLATLAISGQFIGADHRFFAFQKRAARRTLGAEKRFVLSIKPATSTSALVEYCHAQDDG